MYGSCPEALHRVRRECRNFDDVECLRRLNVHWEPVQGATTECQIAGTTRPCYTDAVRAPVTYGLHLHGNPTRIVAQPTHTPPPP